jgi:hypothetical protein
VQSVTRAVVELLVAIVVAFWGWPILVRAGWIGQASLELWKSAPSSASVTEERTLLVIHQQICTGPLQGVELSVPGVIVR